MRLSANFKESEFRSPDSGGVGKGIDPILIAKLEVLRHMIGDKPINVTSGYRTPAHNKKVGGVKNSYHLQGKAADIQVKGMKPYDLYYLATKVFHNGGVGIYRNHVHVDTGKKNRWESF